MSQLDWTLWNMDGARMVQMTEADFSDRLPSKHGENLYAQFDIWRTNYNFETGTEQQQQVAMQPPPMPSSTPSHMSPPPQMPPPQHMMQARMERMLQYFESDSQELIVVGFDLSRLLGDISGG